MGTPARPAGAWLAVIFVSFGLFAPSNYTVIVSLMVASLCVAGDLPGPRTRSAVQRSHPDSERPAAQSAGAARGASGAASPVSRPARRDSAIPLVSAAARIRPAAGAPAREDEQHRAAGRTEQCGRGLGYGDRERV